jgi:hypothetical protein
MANTGKNSKAVLATHMIAGTKKRFPNGSQKLTFGGADHTVDEVTTNLQKFVDNRTAVETAKANARAKVEAERADLLSLLAFIDEYVKFLRTTFGTSADALGDFGIAPPKARVPMSTEAKAVAAAKRQATREARGIVPKKVKQGIKGNVTAKLVVTPETPSAEPSAATTPAPTAGATAPTAATPAPARNG